MFEQMSKTASTSGTAPTPEPEIKITDQQRREADLKSQFKGLSDDLSKETGEAKSAFQRMKDTYQHLQDVDLKAAFKAKKQQMEQETKDSTQEKTTQEQQQTEKKRWELPKMPKMPFAVSVPQPIKQYSVVAKTYVLDALRETFPSSEYKLEKKVQLQQKMAADKELMEKFERGEITGDDAQIPDWKKGALQPVQVKKSIFQKAKEKVQSSVFGTRFEQTAKNLAESERLKNLKTGISSVKSSLEDVKEGISEDLDAADNKYLNTVRNKLSDLRMETEEAKAARAVRAYDQGFDVYELEDEMETLLEDVLHRYDSRDIASLKSLTEGQAQHYFLHELSVPADVIRT